MKLGDIKANTTIEITNINNGAYLVRNLLKFLDRLSNKGWVLFISGSI